MFLTAFFDHGHDSGHDGSRRAQIYKRGHVFRRGPLVIQMFQQEQASILLSDVSFILH